MPIFRCSDQGSQTLEQFYTDTDHEETRIIGEIMLSLIKLLDTNFSSTKIFGLTSLYRLNLLSKDTYQSPWYVTFAFSGQTFYIDYLFPEDEQPWPYARVTGVTDSIEEAFRFILIGMKKSNGWQDNGELNKLLENT